MVPLQVKKKMTRVQTEGGVKSRRATMSSIVTGCAQVEITPTNRLAKLVKIWVCPRRQGNCFSRSYSNLWTPP
jgi:hypothetical protein